MYRVGGLQPLQRHHRLLRELADCLERSLGRRMYRRGLSFPAGKPADRVL